MAVTITATDTENNMIRHNFLADSASARQYIDGVRALKDPVQFPWPGQDGLSIFDVFVFWHHQSMMLMTPPEQTDRNAAHSGPAFLPWHRYFLVRFEGFLQQALNDPNFRLPYWDWSADAELPNPGTSPLWDLQNVGQFIGTGWEIRLAMNPMTGNLQRVSRQLQRSLGMGGNLPTRDQVRTVLRQESTYDLMPFNSSSPSGLRNPLEGWVGQARIHNNVHVWVGGDMGLSSSPNDPVFFLHHCNVDRLWASWQERNASASYLPDMTAPASLQFHRVDDPLYSIFEEQLTPRDMLAYRTYYEYDALIDLATV
jgi:tyrosinase